MRVKPSVVLLAYSMPVNGSNPESVIASAGKLCYSKVGVEEISKNLDDKSISKFLSMLSSMGHYSPYEHLSFTFAIEGISRACSHQLVRHRIASFSQQSQRYVDLKENFIYITPPEIIEDKDSLEVYDEMMQDDINGYKKIVENLYNKYTKNITDKKLQSKALKKALEDARFLLPNACETKIVVTMNARSLLNFFSERCCNRAQWEIKEVANQMLDLVRKVAPNVFIKAGAPCTYSNCNQGSMSCGNKIKPRNKENKNEG